MLNRSTQAYWVIAFVPDCDRYSGELILAIGSPLATIQKPDFSQILMTILNSHRSSVICCLSSTPINSEFKGII
ncbi:MAG: hypothetical protein V7K32_25755 [Nostoc sp.]|uniref:hypothetical protein n=1 Tax=Nostoc sp. TaxID=1180 RepID=UPI002FF9CFD3